MRNIGAANPMASIDIRALPSVEFEERGDLPNQCGIYFVLGSQGAVLYVGRTLDSFRGRWKHHHREEDARQSGADRIAWLTVPRKREIPSLEARCIRELHPPLNRTHPAGSAASIDCLRQRRTKARRQPKYPPCRPKLPEKYFTVESLAAAFGITKATVLARIKSGRLPAINSLPEMKRPHYVIDAQIVNSKLPGSWWVKRDAKRRS